MPDYEAATVNASIKGTRIGVPTNYYFEDMSEEIHALFDASLKTFEELGAEIVQVTVSDHEELADLQNIIMGSEAATLHAHWLQNSPGRLFRAGPGPYTAGARLSRSALPTSVTVAGGNHRAFLRRCLLVSAMSCISLYSMYRSRRSKKPMSRRHRNFPTVLASITRNTRPINYLGLQASPCPPGSRRTAFRRPFNWSAARSRRRRCSGSPPPMRLRRIGTAWYLM